MREIEGNNQSLIVNPSGVDLLLGPTVGGSAVIAVIVVYFPDIRTLRRLLVGLYPQVSAVIVVDNGNEDGLLGALALDLEGQEQRPPIYVHSNGENLGIAAAQNLGIAWAKQRGADFVILFDQDSEPAADMVCRLVAVARAKGAAGVPVAAMGPRYLDSRQNNPPPFIRIEGITLKRQPCPDDEAVVDVDYLIASGCLIPMAALDRVGYMAERLFIDYVDIEWGLRAKGFGLQSFGVCGAVMGHSLGDMPLRFFKSSFPARSPLRHYYMFRNAVWLYLNTDFPLGWKLVDAWRLLLKFGFYSLFAKPRLEHLGMMSKGLWHGLTGRLGRLQGF
jgi:rhamnosyltransferase